MRWLPTRAGGTMMDKFSNLVNTIRSEKWLKYQRIVCELALEIVIVVVFLKAYNLVRNQFGSQKCTPEYALGHAIQVINIERNLFIFWEQEIQGMAIHWKQWIRFWNIFYGSAHMAVTIFVLGYLFALKPGAYQRIRTVFIIMNIIAISGYAGYPLMPPRLVNACDDPYGGCLKQYHFEDTLHTVGGIWSWKDKGVSKVSNHYAAMPSMHAGYSIWCSASMYRYSPHAVFRMLALLYPLLTLYCIVVTANHFFLDAVFGVAVFWLATKLAVYMPRVGRGADESEELGDGEERQALLLPIVVAAGDQAMTKGAIQDGNKSIHLTMATLLKR